ncbi:MAG: hypothetical protein PF638_14885 [Candidatus Delongbacteria bacterium]|jgi:hypothetical protein|nr:hypothetical protein [Candidatus Delongbacteria bacterium]
MSFTVTVTFDIHNSEDVDYDEITKLLESIKLYKSVKSDKNKVIELPNNTYFGEFDSPQIESAGDLRDRVIDWIEKEFKKQNLSSNIFIVIGGDWALGCKTT